MVNAILCHTTTKMELEVTIGAKMKVSEQYGITALECKHILGLITGNITYEEKDVVVSCTTAQSNHQASFGMLYTIMRTCHEK